MKLFLSWSGETSKQIAAELRDWIQLILPTVKPFLSPVDIEKGSKWHGEISKELDATNYGLICLTRDNLESLWLAFEAGALSKNLDGKATAICFGIRHTDVQAPLNMFQNCLFEKDDILNLLKSMNRVGEELQRPEQQIDQIFEKFWPELKTKIDLIIESSKSGTTPETPPSVDINSAVLDRIEQLLALARQQNLMLSSPEKFFAPYVRELAHALRAETSPRNYSPPSYGFVTGPTGPEGYDSSSAAGVVHSARVSGLARALLGGVELGNEADRPSATNASATGSLGGPSGSGEKER